MIIKKISPLLYIKACNAIDTPRNQDSGIELGYLGFVQWHR